MESLQQTRFTSPIGRGEEQSRRVHFTGDRSEIRSEVE
jgi:hypothetical protein